MVTCEWWSFGTETEMHSRRGATSRIRWWCKPPGEMHFSNALQARDRRAMYSGSVAPGADRARPLPVVGLVIIAAAPDDGFGGIPSALRRQAHGRTLLDDL